MIAIMVVWYAGVGKYVTLERFKEHSHYLKQLVTQHYLQAVLIYLVIYAVIIACSLPAVPLLTIAGGFLFGAIPGAIYANIGATVGATIAFLLFRYFFRRFARDRYGARLERFKQQITKYGATYLLILHFITIFPYFVINTLAALTDISIWTFIWTTIVGFIPLSFVYTFAGEQLGCIKSIRDVFSPSMAVAFILLVLLSLLPIIIKRFKRTVEI